MEIMYCCHNWMVLAAHGMPMLLLSSAFDFHRPADELSCPVGELPTSNNLLLVKNHAML
jgi:hypothetical protein